MRRAGLAPSIAIVIASTPGLAAAAVPPVVPGSFAARADKACAVAGAKVLGLPAPTAATVLPDLRSTRTILVTLSGQLKAIKAPPAKARTYAALVAAVDQHAAILGAILTAAAAHQTRKIGSLNRAAGTVAQRRAAYARALGLTACAKHYSPSATTTPKPPSASLSPAVPLDPPPPAAAAASGGPSGGASAATSPTGASGGASGGASPATSPTGASPGGHASQTGTQTFQGTSNSSQSIDTSGGGLLTTG